VEDEAIVALDLSGRLERLGYRISGVAASAEEAIEQADTSPPDVVLMDVRLQGAHDGIHAAECILKRHDVPLIFLTSHNDDETLGRAVRVGAHGYLTKPFDERELHCGIQVALQKSERERTARGKANSEFMGRASHELRTPLNAVIGLAEVIRNQPNIDPTKLSTYAGHIGAAGQQLLGMVNDMLDLDQAGRGELELALQPVALQSAVLDVLAMVKETADKQHLTLTEAIPPRLEVMADPSRLRQVLMNLLSNAVKYNKPGGVVLVHAERSGSSVNLVIEDSGVGIPTEVQSRLFRPLDRLGQDRTTTTGVGLGLSIARAYAVAMGGRLNVVSALDAGTTVTVVLGVPSPG
jgi:signal transduction histidine kinase